MFRFACPESASMQWKKNTKRSICIGVQLSHICAISDINSRTITEHMETVFKINAISSEVQQLNCFIDVDEEASVPYTSNLGYHHSLQRVY
jgi:hypothetical protein